MTARNFPIQIHALESRFQKGPTCIRVLGAERTVATEQVKTVYLLPVEPAGSSEWGDPFPEILEKDLHNKHSLSFVMPSFTAMPWMANHPTAADSQQESYFISDVIPFVEQTYPTLQGAQRLLLGFSKAGFAAFSMLLRHPQLFEKAAAWDAPLGMASVHKYGAVEAFGSQDVFDDYCVWTTLQQKADLLKDRIRFGVFGYGTFRGQIQAAHYRMLQWGIPHHYVDGPRRKHEWSSGWLQEAIEFLADT